ncbi:hypothetical protein LVJ83_03830 [Uruburuella testudinis]|uniref:Uncharacterized protein n=1 Tax=Uruburuella testudinis TaxID=1282863 RepID=A0ABY4DU91_9NEIS|nr:hypothetical protein [Uruburuella testudinis]UOO82600.1 hypothetical protein LVJ83_03830 [Uruburuella testudinis]
MVSDKWFDILAIPNDFGRLKHVGFEYPTLYGVSRGVCSRKPCACKGRLKKCFQTAL